MIKKIEKFFEITFLTILCAFLLAFDIMLFIANPISRIIFVLKSGSPVAEAIFAGFLYFVCYSIVGFILYQITKLMFSILIMKIQCKDKN